MYRPTAIAFDVTNDCVFVVEQFNNRISKWNYSGFTFTLDAGQVTSITVTNGGAGYSPGDQVDISAPTLNIADPVNALAVVGTETAGVIDTITVTNAGNGYDPNNLPTVTATTGGSGAILAAVVSTPWGNNGDGTTGEGAPVTSLTDNALYHPTGIVYDGTRLYVTDTLHNRFRLITPGTGVFTHSVGQGGSGVDEFYHPAGIAVSEGNTHIVIADELNHRAIVYDVGATPNTGTVMDSPTPVAFNRPHGVFFDITEDNFDIADSQTGVVSRYSTTGASFIAQTGTPGTTGTKLFFPSSGQGLLTVAGTVFADTRNNTVKTIDGINIFVGEITGNNPTVAGTGDGEFYYPESVVSFDDANEYALVANTLNNRVEVFDGNGNVLGFENNFGSP